MIPNCLQPDPARVSHTNGGTVAYSGQLFEIASHDDAEVISYCKSSTDVTTNVTLYLGSVTLYGLFTMLQPPRKRGKS